MNAHTNPETEGELPVFVGELRWPQMHLVAEQQRIHDITLIDPMHLAATDVPAYAEPASIWIVHRFDVPRQHDDEASDGRCSYVRTLRRIERMRDDLDLRGIRKIVHGDDATAPDQ